MKLRVYFLLVFLLVLTPHKLFSQTNKKPKVALVLSGGGAKGIAHIPLLQKLDSLNIVPDLVVGTSIGSLIGGFYAMGYSGDRISSIVDKANWDDLLGGKTALEDVSVEEKNEFGRYLVDFEFKDMRLKTSPALLNDQHLREFFAIHSYPVYDKLYFNDLPIPYRAVATDIVNGEEVILDRGSIAVAMRASMSIPSVFKPVSYKDVLLVDGGILNNFPTDVAEAWGADIIIGSDVGGGMQSKEELEGFSNILFQSAMLISNKKNEESKRRCDILIDHVPNLSYSTGDFKKSKEIYNEGLVGVNGQFEKLVQLSNELQKYPQNKVSLPVVDSEIVLDTIVYKGINKANLGLVKSRFDIKPKDSYSVEEIVDGVHRVMGTTLFSQVKSKPIEENGVLGIEIEAHENHNHRIRTALHFDNNRGLGLLVNYTARNILLKSSRLLVTVDIAKQPRYRVQYQKQFGEDKSWWYRGESLYEFLNQKVYVGGNLFSEELNINYYHFYNQINKNINHLNSYVGFGLNEINTNIKPKINPDLQDNLVRLKSYSNRIFELDIHYLHNSLDNVFFATRGTYFKSRISRTLYNKFNYESTETDKLTVNNGNLNDIFRFRADYEKRFLTSKKNSVIISAGASFTFEDKVKTDEFSFSKYGFGTKYMLGGFQSSSKEYIIPFLGLHENEVFNISQVVNFSLRSQYNVLDKIYITPHINYAAFGYGSHNDFFEDKLVPRSKLNTVDEVNKFVYTLGATASYNSILGPVNFDVSYANGANNLRLFFGVGLFFNISD